MTTLATRNRIIETAAAFRLLADPTRCKILLALVRKPSGMCVYEIADMLGVSHSGASHQLGKMERAGVLAGFREGQMVCYRIAQTSRSRIIVKVLRAIHYT